MTAAMLNTAMVGRATGAVGAGAGGAPGAPGCAWAALVRDSAPAMPSAADRILSVRVTPCPPLCLTVAARVPVLTGAHRPALRASRAHRAWRIARRDRCALVPLGAV